MKQLEAQTVDFSKLNEATASCQDALVHQTIFWELFWEKVQLIPTDLRKKFSLYVRGSCVAELIDHSTSPETTQERHMITQVLTLFAEQFAERPSTFECNLSRFFEQMYHQVNPIPNVDLYFLVPNRDALNQMCPVVEGILFAIDDSHPGLFSDDTSVIRTGSGRRPTIFMYKVRLRAAKDREINVFIKIKNDQFDAVASRSFRQQRAVAPVQIGEGGGRSVTLVLSQANETYHASDRFRGETFGNKAEVILNAGQTLRFNILHSLCGGATSMHPVFIEKLRTIIINSAGVTNWGDLGKYANQLAVAFCLEPKEMIKIAPLLGTEVLPNFNQPTFQPEGNIAQRILEIFRAENIEELLDGFEGPAIENMYAREWLEKFLERWRTTFDEQATDEQKEYFGDPRMLVFLFLAFVPKDLYRFKKTISFSRPQAQSD